MSTSAGSYANWEDLPEVAMAGGAGPLSRRVGYRSDRTKFRVKSLALPVLGECEDEWQTPSSLDEYAPSSWPCRVCTFVNPGWLQQCQMCENLAKDSAWGRVDPTTPNVTDTADASWEWIAAEDAKKVEANTLLKEDDWPSLLDACHSFADCEVSSIGSSWLDIHEADYVTDEDSEFVNLSERAAHESWAARAKLIARHGPVPTIPLAGATMPPFRQTCVRTEDTAKATAPTDEESCDLHCLQDRRARPQGMRGSRQRRHIKTTICKPSTESPSF